MAFSEKVKNETRRRSCFRCVICHDKFVEIHHIISQAEGGNDTIENAAPLCASCHDLFGGNPEKRKQIREMRDHWFDLMEKRFNGEINTLEPIQKDQNNLNMLKSKGIAIYHVVYEHEDFKTSASILIKLLQNAQKRFPNYKRHLYLDIEGHRNKKGGFDHDMRELQKDFSLGFLMQYFTSIHMPLVSVENNKLQINDVPEEINIISDEKELVTKMRKKSKYKHFVVYPTEENNLS
ncbi:HNH endonuclease [Paenibacillus sp. EKM212P]|uniref:HNH endonuclease n=1 Tax=Paenibacillus sp. EKM212P TaxID=1683680 RepID=UPI0013ED1F75|nr:HNH endonuclease [Paenibacillus sp. EKM212P]KAF6578390.1 HNH endonuclease [Paenibacillus sp. EKM212P]